jgi:hypothetical protein
MYQHLEGLKGGWLSSDGDEKIFVTFIGQGDRE